MATYVLIHEAGDVGWYWHLVDRELRTRGHSVVVRDMPVDDARRTFRNVCFFTAASIFLGTCICLDSNGSGIKP